jgi:hypothetical protein
MRVIPPMLAAIALLTASGAARKSPRYVPEIPRTWDEAALATLELPLVDPAHSPQDISAAEYYSIPVRPIYRTYPKYHPDKQPRRYIESLQHRDPVVLWDDGPHRPKLASEADWIKAGEMVFNAPVIFFPESNDDYASRVKFMNDTGDLYDGQGVSPFAVYVVRERGKVETGEASCAECHSRVLADGSVIRGAQGNRPIEKIKLLGLAADVAAARDPDAALADARAGERILFGAPWLRPDPQARLDRFSAAEIEAAHAAIPSGVFARQGTSPFSPAKLPDLIGIRERKYLDASGLVRHRSIGDLMRYAALNQGMDLLARFGDFIPAGTGDWRALPRDSASRARYSDEQLYALARYIYSLEPPPNPNRPTPLTVRGAAVFERERCGRCHTPPQYTNNMVTPASGFTIPPDHLARFDILPVDVGTDPTLTRTTRRGTGYYKVPSLKGVWYRGPFEHNGSVATLEDWFDPRRLRDDYAPTGYRPVGVQTRAVRGHAFGLRLSPEDRAALIAFLRTL